MAALATRRQRRRMRIHPVGPPGMRGNQPPFEIPGQPPGEPADQASQRPGRVHTSRYSDVIQMHLPINHVIAAWAKAAQGQRRGGSNLRHGVQHITPWGIW